MFELKFNKISFRNKLKLVEEIMSVLDGVDDWEILQHVVREVYIAQVYLSNYDKFEQTKKDEDDVDYLDIMETYEVLYELGFEEFMENETPREYKLVNELIDTKLHKKKDQDSVEWAIKDLIQTWSEKTKDLDVKDVMEKFENLDMDKFSEVKKMLEINRGTNERR